MHIPIGFPKQFMIETQTLMNVILILSHIITDGDPSNYLTYFKRAAVYLAMGQTKKALPDFTSCINLKPDFEQVYTTCIMHVHTCTLQFVSCKPCVPYIIVHSITH